MANIYEGNTNFLHGLSDLWTRFFRDRPRLEAMYKGTEILAGQAYLDLVGNILCLSAREIPVFRKEFFKLVLVREDLVTERDDGGWEFEVTDEGIKDFQLMYNKIFDPTVVLEKNVDFAIENALIDAIVFFTNPFDWDGVGGTIPGVASRSVTVVDDDGNETEERELAFWVPDTQIDAYDMYLNFGYLIGRFEASSEAYRALIQGILQYFVLGPTEQHLTSALNVIVGLPVVRDDGEILQSVDYSGEDDNIVVTDRANYSFPKVVPLRDDVTDTANWGVYEFVAFEHLTTVFTVLDAIIDPTWWYDREIPDKLLPDENRLRRQVTPQMFENLVDEPEGLVKVGDPGVFAGADYDGYVPAIDGDHPTPYTGPGYEANTSLWRPTYRPGFGFMIYELFLKYHTFVVDFNHEALQSGFLPFELLNADLGNIIDAGKSAYTYMIAEPGLNFTDRLRIDSDTDDKLEIDVTLAPDDETLEKTDTSFFVGETSIVVGDYYSYGPGDGITINNAPWPGPLPDASGNTPVVVGGADPSIAITTEAEVTGVPGSLTTGPSYEGELNLAFATFTSGDVGKYVRTDATGGYYRIQRYSSPFRVWVIPNTGPAVGGPWNLYAWSPAAYGDWPVEITVT